MAQTWFPLIYYGRYDYTTEMTWTKCTHIICLTEQQHQRITVPQFSTYWQMNWNYTRPFTISNFAAMTGKLFFVLANSYEELRFLL